MFDAREIFHDMTAQFLSPPQADPGDTVEIRLRTGAADVISVDLILCVNEHVDESGGDIIYVRSSMRRDPENREGFSVWRGRVRLSDEPLCYFFEIRLPWAKVLYDRTGITSPERGRVFFRLIPGLRTPAWAEGAVMYQIFTDRFSCGDMTNTVLSGEYCYNGSPVKQVENWAKLPDPGGADIREFYGGDLQGIINKLDYLEDLGIQVLYLNPIFVSPSTHKYDTQDYAHIDPHFGRIIADHGQLLPEGSTDNTQATRYITRVTSPENLEASDALFALLVRKAHEHGIRVIIDGVFNHCGSFNRWMDREKIYQSAGDPPGAFAAEDSPYHDFFSFYGEDWPDNAHYEGWWGYDTLPKLNYEGSEKLVEEILRIAEKWVSPPFNADGWRLDVAADLGHSETFNHDFWRRFRERVKKANPEAVILAEHYGDAGPWLFGGEWDSVMNYDAFMEPVSFFFTGMEKHSDRFEPGAVGNEERFWDTISGSAARSFPQSSLGMAMNELSNHDHSRFLTRTNGKVGRSSTLGPQAANEDTSMEIFREAVLLQMTWPGAPTLYYGDEAGLCGFTDPDNRRTYPWGKEDRGLIAFHKDMIRIHRENPELIRGSLMRLNAQRGVIAYGRFLEDSACIVLINRNEYAVTDDYDVYLLGIPGQAVVRQLIMTNSIGYHTSAEERFVKNGRLTATLSQKTAVVYKYARGLEHDAENFRTHAGFLNFR